MMDEDILEKYLKAGKIAAEVCSKLRAMLKPGVKLMDVAEFAENEMRKLGGEPAFPINISINDVAAHYTPQFNDEKVIGSRDLVKIDVGVHVDGYIGDTAFTWCAEENKLIGASEKVLDAAIAVIRPGVTVSEIGSAIEAKAKELGVGVIVNLTGHTLDRFVFHGAPSIPNVKNDNKYAFNEDDVIAIEPFVLESNGTVKDSTPVEIYRYVMGRPVRLAEARKILELAAGKYNELPFAKRWLAKEGMSPLKVQMALNQLEQLGAIETYPTLKESRGRPIVQAEHTIIVRDKPIVTTRMAE
ncbi:MAG: type II methionyl aminopeptidase [Candidatus Aenigmarchaeota archaeon]|nr:type II methionyl aminopeptidase [Candidatus Aenigmarchaeota archaeon]